MKRANIFAILMLASSVVLASAGAEHGGGEEHGIPWKAIGVQAINLGILLVILLYFISAPLKAMFKAKKDSFLEESEKTAAALKLAELELSDAKTKLAHLENSEKSALEKAQKEAFTTADKIVVDAHAQGKKIVEDTTLIIAAEVSNAKNQIREKIINKSMATAELNLKASAESITKKSETGFLQDLGQVRT